MCLGAGVRQLWAIEDGLRFINHGAVSALPREIAAEQTVWRERVERDLGPAALQVIAAKTFLI